jgi:phosphoribosylaminoimidazolecarboxamide formyltransferase/IMP cyclohydrolase
LAFNRVEKLCDLVSVRRALVSVYSKEGLEDLVLGLARACPGIEILSTGGSHAAIAALLAARPGTAASLVSVADYTGQAEMAGGLVKTLDWKIYLGLLAEPGNAEHEADLARQGALSIDLVVGDLYPFEEAAADGRSGVEDLRQRIDIGGPAMIRAAAKNFPRVVSLSSPGQYAGLLEEVGARAGATRLEYRLKMAAAAFRRVSAFDDAVARRLDRLSPAELAASYRLEA